MKTTSGGAAAGLAAKMKRGGMLVLIACAVAVGLTSCAPYYGPPTAGYYSAGYDYPYGYGYGYPYAGPYYGPYGYGGASIVISGARYHGYRSPYYRNHYYPRTQVRPGTSTTGSRSIPAPPRLGGSRTRGTNNPRTQATLPQ